VTIVDRLRELSRSFEPPSQSAEELKRLTEFFGRMKREGIATTRKYDLPQLDTIGRAVHDAKLSPVLQEAPGWRRQSAAFADR
jgi:hypothetical protein